MAWDVTGITLQVVASVGLAPGHTTGGKGHGPSAMPCLPCCVSDFHDILVTYDVIPQSLDVVPAVLVCSRKFRPGGLVDLVRYLVTSPYQLPWHPVWRPRRFSSGLACHLRLATTQDRLDGVVTCRRSHRRRVDGGGSTEHTLFRWYHPPYMRCRSLCLFRKRLS